MCEAASPAVTGKRVRGSNQIGANGFAQVRLSDRCVIPRLLKPS